MISADDFMHPEDQAALNALKAIPAFSSLVKGFMNYGVERMVHGTNLASKIRLSPTQLPEIYNLLPPICQKLGIDVPEFYLEMNPFPNAYTLGDSIISITVTSGLIQCLSAEEIRSALAHECGHIACRHCLYQTMAMMILNGVDIFGMIKVGPMARMATVPIRYALLYWYRQSELSADRAAALVSGVAATLGTHIRISGGPLSITSKIDVDEWARQADEYESLKQENKWDKVLQTYAGMNRRHPFSAVRVREILKWGESPRFAELKAQLDAEGDGKGGKPAKSTKASAAKPSAKAKSVGKAAAAKGTKDAPKASAQGLVGKAKTVARGKTIGGKPASAKSAKPAAKGGGKTLGRKGS